MKAFFDFEKKHHGIGSTLIYENVYTSKDPIILSIAIPTYKRPDYLKECLRSLFNAVYGAKDLAIEVVVIDNDLEQSSWPLIRESFDFDSMRFKFRYFANNQNIGMFGNWSKCIELPLGKWLSILNDDDYFREDTIRQFFKYLNDEDDIYIFQHVIANERDKSLKTKSLNRLKNFRLRKTKKMTLNRYYWGMPSMGSLGVFLKRENALKVGGFADELFPISDWVFFSKHMQMIKSGLEINIPCVYYRIATNESINPTVANNSLKVGFEFRTFLGNILGFQLNTFYCRMFFLIRVKGNERLWKIPLKEGDIMKEYGIEWYHHALFPFFRMFVFLKRVI